MLTQFFAGNSESVEPECQQLFVRRRLHRAIVRYGLM